MERQQKSYQNECLKSAIMFLAPAFIFSVIIFSSSASSSLLLPCVLNLVQFVTGKTDKSYVFVLCNGILVVIAKCSGPVRDRKQDIHLGQSRNCDQQQDIHAELPEVKTVVYEEKVQADEQHGVDEPGRERESVHINEDEDEDNEEQGEVDLMSIDELNKRCDEFIRKMKEGIKMEVQQLCHASVLTMNQEESQ